MGEPNRKLAAIMSADVVGYSRLMAHDEAATVATLQEYRAAIDRVIVRHKGRVVNAPGDNILAEFPSAVEAVRAAVAIQKNVEGRNMELPDERRMPLRVGVNLGDVIEEADGTIYGDGVNIAARMEALAEPGGICISSAVYDAVQGKIAFGFEFLGEQQVKNIDRPITVYRVRSEPGVPSAAPATPTATGSRRSLLLAAAGVVLLVVAGLAVWQATRAPSPPPHQAAHVTAAPENPRPKLTSEDPVPSLDPHRIAVLPFANISRDPDDEYFADGMTEELIAKLSRLRSLTVIARTSVMQYRGTVKAITEIGSELRIGTILEGSVRRDGDQLRITAQLIDVASEGHLWSEIYDRPFADVFAVQSDVAQQVARALRVTLQAGETERIESPETEDLEAYELYLEAVFHRNKMIGEGLQTGRALFEQAVARDPGFARAYAGLAQAYEMLGEFGYVPVKDAFPKAMAAAETALAIDDGISEAHSVLALMKTYLYFDWQAAEEGHRRAIEADPDSALAIDLYGVLYLTPRGRHDEAITAVRRGIDLDPLAVVYRMDLGWVYYHARRLDEAAAQFQKVLELEPEFAHVYRGLGMTLAAKGMFEPAIEAIGKAVRYSDESAYQLGGLGWAYALAGRRDEALAVLDRLQAMAEQGLTGPMDFVFLHIGLGNNDEAFALLDAAYEEQAGSWMMISLATDATFDPLRSDPRFEPFLKKIGLSD